MVGGRQHKPRSTLALVLVAVLLVLLVVLVVLLVVVVVLVREWLGSSLPKPRSTLADRENLNHRHPLCAGSLIQHKFEILTGFLTEILEIFRYRVGEMHFRWYRHRTGIRCGEVILRCGWG